MRASPLAAGVLVAGIALLRRTRCKDTAASTVYPSGFDPAFVEFANSLADKAREVILPYWRRPIEVSQYPLGHRRDVLNHRHPVLMTVQHSQFLTHQQ